MYSCHRRNYTLCIFLLSYSLLMISCSSSTFQSFYNTEKEDARIAMAFPKYFAMVAIPDDAKDEIKYFTKGMKKVRLLFFDEKRMKHKPFFSEFADRLGYTPYIIAKDNGAQIFVYALEDQTIIKEIVLDINSNKEGFVVALIGKMDKQTFAQALDRAKAE